MSRSVLTTSEVQGRYVSTLVDEWIALGLRDVVLCPGSRSTPLALVLSSRRELRIFVRLDERSAGFFALGRALESGRPTLIAVTSGTAAAELHACVAEAHHAGVPLLVVTADRPPRLHGVGAPQTIDQRHLYGGLVNEFVEPGVAQWSQRTKWRTLARRSFRATLERHPGPVHFNAAFEEPLVVSSYEPEPVSTLPDPDQEATSDATLIVPTELEHSHRVLCVAGQSVSSDEVARLRERGWVVVGDAVIAGATPFADVAMRDDQLSTLLRPDVVVRLGGLPTSKFLFSRIASWGVPVIGIDRVGTVRDPDRVITRSYSGLLDLTRLSTVGSSYGDEWRRVSDAIAQYLNETDSREWDEVTVARLVVRGANATQTPFVVGSSMPVRDVEWWTEARNVPTFANRGVNGIDGVVSTFLGVAFGGSAIGLVGDLTFLHDVSGLVDGLTDEACGVLVVSDNRGGGIFSFLAQSSALDSSTFEQLFGTPPRHRIEDVARGFGCFTVCVTNADELSTALTECLSRRGLSVIVARVPSREENVRRHANRVNEAIERAKEALR